MVAVIAGALAAFDMVGEDVVLAHRVLPDEGEMALLSETKTGLLIVQVRT